MRIFLILVVLVFLLSCSPAEKTTNKNGIVCYAGAKLIDGSGAPPQPNQSLLVQDGKITDIGPDICLDRLVSLTIDLGGRTIVPGLIDAHVHLTSPASPPLEKSLPYLLNNGVTSVREMGGIVPRFTEIQGKIERGERIGPDIYATANVFGPSFMRDPRTLKPGYARGEAPYMRLVSKDSNPEDVVRAAKATGATGLKFYSGLERGLIKKLTAEAHKQGLQVWSHSVVWPTKPSAVSASGVDVMSHAHGLYAEFADEIPDDIGKAIRIWLPQQDFSGIDVNSEPFTSLFAQMRKNNQILEPTLFALDERRGTRPPPRKPSQQPRVDFEAFSAFSCAATQAAMAQGVPIAAGTDTFGITMVIEELLLLTKCGASPLDAITAATSTNARALGIADRVGTLTVGMQADFVVLNADPLLDLNNLRDIYFVVKRGKKFGLIEPNEP